MARKSSEQAFSKMIRGYYGYYSRKLGDRRYCPNCRFLLPKTEQAPDYVVAQTEEWVECKNSDATGRWTWSEITMDGPRHNQRQWLKEYDGWLFILLGNKRAPKGKSAYLIPFLDWMNSIEPTLIEHGMKSIRKETKGERPGGDDLMPEYMLEWEPGEGWFIPKGHPWWAHRVEKLKTAYWEAVDGLEK